MAACASSASPAVAVSNDRRSASRRIASSRPAALWWKPPVSDSPMRARTCAPHQVVRGVGGAAGASSAASSTWFRRFGGVDLGPAAAAARCGDRSAAERLRSSIWWLCGVAPPSRTTHDRKRRRPPPPTSSSATGASAGLSRPSEHQKPPATDAAFCETFCFVTPLGRRVKFTGRGERTASPGRTVCWSKQANLCRWRRVPENFTVPRAFESTIVQKNVRN